MMHKPRAIGTVNLIYQQYIGLLRYLEAKKDILERLVLEVEAVEAKKTPNPKYNQNVRNQIDETLRAFETEKGLVTREFEKLERGLRELREVYR